MAQMQTPPEVVAPPAGERDPVIEMRDISITFGAVRALDGVSLRLSSPARCTP